jgi:hypothetical protein
MRGSLMEVKNVFNNKPVFTRAHHLDFPDASPYWK